MSNISYRLYRSSLDPSEVYRLGCFVAKQHSTYGMPYDLIAQRLGWYDKGLNEDDLQQFGEDHQRAVDHNLSWDMANSLLAPVRERGRILNNLPALIDND